MGVISLHQRTNTVITNTIGDGQPRSTAESCIIQLQQCETMIEVTYQVRATKNKSVRTIVCNAYHAKVQLLVNTIDDIMNRTRVDIKSYETLIFNNPKHIVLVKHKLAARTHGAYSAGVAFGASLPSFRSKLSDLSTSSDAADFFVSEDSFASVLGTTLTATRLIRRHNSGRSLTKSSW